MKTRWFSAGKNKRCRRFLFPLGMLPLVGFVSGWFCIPKHQLQTVPTLFRSFCSPLSFCFTVFHQPPLAMVLCLPQLEHWSLTSVQLCGLDAAHLLSLYAFSLLFIHCIPFPCSDQSAAVGSPRGWEIPTASSHCMTIQNNTPDLQLSAQHDNQDHLETKLRLTRPQTFTCFSSLPLTLSVTCRVM